MVQRPQPLEPAYPELFTCTCKCHTLTACGRVLHYFAALANAKKLHTETENNTKRTLLTAPDMAHDKY
jgi:hypothetical protein